MVKLKTAMLLGLSVSWGGTLCGQGVQHEEEQGIRRLPADSFPGIPEHVRQAMHRLSCVVPQGSELGHPHNVLVGSFARVDQVDWVFLCSTNGVSAIHVLWGGAAACPTPVMAKEDGLFMQDLGGGRWGFSRRLVAAQRDRMMTYEVTDEGHAAERTWYSGIEDCFEGKGQVVLLCVDGIWISVSGVDE